MESFEDDKYSVERVFQDALLQYERSTVRARALEVVAYVFAGLQLLAAVALFAFAINEKDSDIYWVALATVATAVFTFFSISWFSHLLGTSAHQLRVSAYHMLGELNDDED